MSLVPCCGPGSLSWSGEQGHEAISAAGGSAPGADPDQLNLAAVLEDGQKIVVPRQGETRRPRQHRPAGQASGGRIPGTCGRGRRRQDQPEHCRRRGTRRPSRAWGRYWRSASWTGAANTGRSAGSRNSTQSTASGPSCSKPCCHWSGCDLAGVERNGKARGALQARRERTGLRGRTGGRDAETPPRSAPAREDGVPEPTCGWSRPRSSSGPWPPRDPGCPPRRWRPQPAPGARRWAPVAARGGIRAGQPRPGAPSRRSVRATLAVAFLAAAAEAAQRGRRGFPLHDGAVPRSRCASGRRRGIGGRGRPAAAPSARESGGLADRWAVPVTLRRHDLGRPQGRRGGPARRHGRRLGTRLPGQRLRATGKLRPAEPGSRAEAVLSKLRPAGTVARAGPWQQGPGGAARAFTAAAGQFGGDAARAAARHGHR